MRRTFKLPIPLSLLVAGALLTAGCSSKPVTAPTTSSGESRSAASRDDELHNGLRYVQHMQEYDYDKASEKSLGSLNSWLATLTEETPYKVDPLRDRLPKEIKPFFPPENLTAGKFRSDDYVTLRQYFPGSPVQTPIALGVRSGDFRYLHQTSLFRSISQWAVKQPADPDLEAWLAEQSKTLDERSARKLREVTRLFDWTVRHLQLDPAAPEPSRAASGPSATGAAKEQILPPQLQGMPGPGYTIFPEHALLLGHGDYLQRAWVFCLLARQVECDVLMLAFENAESGRPEPWASGAIIGDQVYLFDARLGLPLPLENDRGIATLKQVRENDALLRRLDLSTEMVYPANTDSLKRLVGLIEFSDASISQRMAKLESRLTGDEQMVLAVRPSDIAEAARKAGVTQVYPWRIAYDAILFRATIEAGLRNNFQFYMQYYTMESPFQRPNLLAEARFKHLSGLFTTDGEDKGALDDYMSSRVANQDIAQLEKSEEGQKLLATKVMGNRELTDQDKLQILNAQKTSLMIAKTHATYFMGQAQYDLGAYPVAVEWFQKRTIEAQAQSPWISGAKYNLARSLEMQQKYREARAIYLADQSPQKEGNLIRARRIKPLADAEPEAPAKPSTTEPAKEPAKEPTKEPSKEEPKPQ